MARPPKEGLDYFPHDCGAADDTDKVEAMRLLYGNDGYAFYFITLERIYKTKDQELDISDAETRQILNKKLMVDEQKFEQMLATALKRGLFDKEHYEQTGRLTSHGIKKRAAIVLKKREAQAERDEQNRREKRALQHEETTAENPVSAAENPAEMTQSKVKESKEKKSIENDSEKTSTPTAQPPEPPPSEGKIGPLSLEVLTARYTPEECKTLKEYWTAIRQTRQTGKIAKTVIQKYMDKWHKYPTEMVIEGLKIHLSAHRGKREDYTDGIIRRIERDRRTQNGKLTGNSGQDTGKAEANIIDYSKFQFKRNTGNQ